MTENSAVFFFVSTVLNFASTVLSFASTVFFFVSTVLNFASTKKVVKVDGKLRNVYITSQCARDNLRGQKSLGPLKMSLEMAHKVIVPPKKNYIPQFLKQRDINSYYRPE
jgi:hypothetical protein